MILAIKNADFSAKNLGNIAFDKELDPNVENILAHLTRFPADKTNSYVQALNALYIGLDDSGLLAKVLCLNVPFMASTIAECAFDLSTQENNNSDPSILFTLGADHELHHKAAGTLYNARNYSFNLSAAAPSDKVSVFGILNPHSETTGVVFGKGGKNASDNYSSNGYAQRSSGGNFQVRSTGVDIAPAGHPGIAFGTFALPNGAFVASFANGDFYYMQDNLMRYGEWTPGTAADMYFLSPLNWYYPTTDTNTNKGVKLFGATSQLSEAETKQLYAIINRFNTAISA